MRVRSALLGWVVVALVWAGDWPQWRGPGRDGAVVSFQGPQSWPEKLTQKWKITVGEGHSSPIFAAGRVFLLTRQQEEEVVLSIDPDQGKIRWRQGYATPYQMNPAAVRHGKGPKSTPLFHDGKIYTLGISGTLSCFEAQSGRLRWRKEFSKQFKETSPLYGTAMSPVVDHGLLIVHVGGNDDGALAAFDARSGEQKWMWKGDGPGYASPIVVEAGGVRQVVTQTQKNIVGVSAATGELLWRMGFTTPYVQNVVTPLEHQGTLIVSGLSKGTMGLRVGAKSAEKVWHNAEISMYMNSPVVSGDLLFGFANRNKGEFFCMDPRTGAVRWTSEPRQGENAAMVAAGDKLILLTNDGELRVARASGKAFEVLRRYAVADSATWAHPLVLDKGIVIKDATTLAFWSF